MTNNEEERDKLTNIQLNKLKSAAKNNTGKILRISKKNFQNEELPHGLFLTSKRLKYEMPLLRICLWI